MARLAVVGPGAIGATVAAWLGQDRAHEVVIGARTGFDALHVDTPAGPLVARPRVGTDPDAVGPVDLVLVATKTYDLPTAWLARLVDDRTVVAVLQNGVEHVARFAPLVPADRVLPVIVDVPCARHAPGRATQRSPGSLTVAAGGQGRAFVAAFAHVPRQVLAVRTTDDLPAVAWTKLAVNCAVGVCAVRGEPLGASRRPEVAARMRALAAECVAVGRAEGVELPDDLPDAVVARYQAMPTDALSSIVADRLAGRPMEIDARHGVLVRRGAAHGIPTPENAAVVAALTEAGGRGRAG
ncbi:MAG: 2-dehydropantoate 2-reductase [Alphaproteobacteria bacterium]|nr:2-dehydropantoate 2-reductase [Alphaproteobacteria bacterium]